jgi:hypothetical protein
LSVAGDRSLVCVVGNKTDAGDSVALSEADVRERADAHDFPYAGRSAKRGDVRSFAPSPRGS